MHHLIRDRLDASFVLYDELVAVLSDEQLALKLPVPSNTVSGQLWCVIGSRESWARAIEDGAWAGWSCSVDAAGARSTSVMAGALRTSGQAVREALDAAPDDEARAALALGLLEHESQHQGQLLRYLLGLRLGVPAGWKQRFAL